MTDPITIETLKAWNAAFREGTPVVDDAQYDVEHARLKAAYPGDPFFNAPEPEATQPGRRVKHTRAMLSTDKCYTASEVEAWARTVGVDTEIRVTPKLDGIAGYDDGTVLVTRGRNGYGNDITHIFQLGVVPVGGRGLGAGELVLDLACFDRLKEEYGLKHPRNIVAGLAGADTLKPYHRAMLDAGAVRFVPYSTLEGKQLRAGELADSFEAIIAEYKTDLPYLTDGAVADVIDEGRRRELGSTSTHHRWQVALKVNDEFADVVIESVELSTGRTGRVTPVIKIPPTELFGVTVTNVTAHNAGYVADHQIGPGAVVSVTRGGGVIPTIVRVSQPSPTPTDMSHCPACGGETVKEGERYVVCPHTSQCPVQTERSLVHFFGTLGVCKGFGPAVCEQLVASDLKRPAEVFEQAQTSQGLAGVGISPGIAANLEDELDNARRQPIPENIWLAAFGLRDLGRGDSRKLLEVFTLEQVLSGAITPGQLQQVEGFGPKTSGSIVAELNARIEELRAVFSLGWNLESVRVSRESVVRSPILDKTIVFTGTMVRGNRDAMKKEARAMGAKVAGSVTSKTDILVAGDKVGAKKISAAEQHGVTVLTEDAYLAMIGQQAAA